MSTDICSQRFSWQCFSINTLRPRQDGRHFADDFFTCIFFNEKLLYLIKFLLKYVRKGPIDNNPALVQIMAWRRPGDKPLSEPMMVSLPTNICVTRPQWPSSLINIHYQTSMRHINPIACQWYLLCQFSFSLSLCQFGCNGFGLHQWTRAITHHKISDKHLNEL